MKPPVTDPLQPRCGNCYFWDKIDPQPGQPAEPVMGVCTGLPPTILLLGAQPKKFGAGVNLMTEMCSPNVPAIRPPCALHRPQNLPILGMAPKLAN